MPQQFPLLLVLALLLLSPTLYAQPANDNCTAAIPINEVSDLAFSTLDTNSDGPYHPNPPCPGGGTLDSFFHDIWYLYSPTHQGYSRFSVCGTADFDTKIAVYQAGASCPLQDGDLLQCNEDFRGCNNATSEVIFAVNPGQSYLLRLAGYGRDDTGESGTGTFTVEQFLPIPGDFCIDALEVTLGLEQSFSTVGALTDGPNHPSNSACFGFFNTNLNADIWYTFTPNFTGTVEWSTCDQISFDSRLAVYGPGSTCPVVDGDLYACNDDGAGCSNYSSLLRFDVEANQRYLLRLGGLDGAQGNGLFDLIEISPAEPPANDLCTNATEVPLINATMANAMDTLTLGTTFNATFDPDNYIFPYCLENVSGGEFAEVWYRFNSGNFTEIECRMRILTPDAAFYLDLWQADCSDRVDSSRIRNNCVFSDEGVTEVRPTFSVLEENTDYILRIQTRLTTDFPGDFSIQLVNEIVVSSQEIDRPASLSFFPNPTTDQLHIQLNLKEAAMTDFRVINTLGEVVAWQREGKLGSGQHQRQLQVSALPTGLYFLVLHTDDQQQTFRFIKE
ncbi:MAG: T9SS type A sorting domain-containing protein [Bacteroidota bacterium]